MLASRVSRTGISALYFALLARALGVQGYGAFAGTCALASVLAPFASFGSGNLLIRAVARDPRAFAVRWGNCLFFTAVSGSLLTGVAVIAARGLLPKGIPTGMLVKICIADLLFARLLDLSGMAFQAFEKLHMTAWLSFGLTFSRLTAAAVLTYARPLSTANCWASLYLASTAVAGLTAMIAVHRHIDFPLFRSIPSVRDLIDGSSFSISLAAQTIYNDIDKTMLARMVSLEAAGLYGAAYRVIDAAFSPVNALLHAAYPNFFQHGMLGLPQAARFARRFLLEALTYCFVVGVLLFALAPCIPALMGVQFASTVFALRFLVPTLVFRGTHVFAADALTGSDHQGVRTLIQLFVAFINILVNIAWLPRFGWRGACYSTLLCDALLALLLWSAIGILIRHQRHTLIPLPAR